MNWQGLTIEQACAVALFCNDEIGETALANILNVPRVEAREIVHRVLYSALCQQRSYLANKDAGAEPIQREAHANRVKSVELRILSLESSMPSLKETATP